MQGLMQDRPLLISSLISFADRFHGDTEIVSRTIEGPIHRYTYRDAHKRARRAGPGLAAARRQGRRPHRHAGLERLPPSRDLLRRLRHGRGLPHDQPAALSRADRLHHQPCRGQLRASSTSTFAPLVEKLAPHCPKVRGWVAHDRSRASAETQTPGALCYEDLLAAARRRSSNGRRSTRTRPPRSATPRAPPAIPRACCIRIARPCCIPIGAALPDAMGLSARDVGAAGGADVPCQCLGHSLRRAAGRARSWCSPARSSTARACTSCSRARR